MRRFAPYGAYRALVPAPVNATDGDVAARCRVKSEELRESFRLIDLALEALRDRALPSPAPVSPGAGTVTAVTEGARGAESISVTCEADGALHRIHVISASYRNWPRRHASDGGRHRAGLSARQQELQPLLRVRGPVSMNDRFAKSLGLRHLVCGSCNGCEHEMNALANPVYDLTQNGWDIVASPRHADVVTVTGPMTQAMREAAGATLAATPHPRVVLAVGDCASGNGPWSGAPSAGPGAGVELDAELAVPGCPPTPEAIKRGLAEAARLLDAKRRRG